MSKDTPAEEVNKAQEESKEWYDAQEYAINNCVSCNNRNSYEACQCHRLEAAFIAGAKWQSSPPDAGKEQEAVWFAEWIEQKAYAYVHSGELKKSAWVNCKENDVLMNGSDYHYTTLINNFGKTTSELYTLYKQNK